MEGERDLKGLSININQDTHGGGYYEGRIILLSKYNSPLKFAEKYRSKLMAREDRIKIIKEIQDNTNSNVISYVGGDRQGLGFPIAGDVIRILYEHLLLLSDRGDRKKNLSLFLYSRGGHGDVPWQIIPMMREFYEELFVLVPYRAYSAATLIALGADKIIMGRKGELGPVDPSIQSPLHPVNPYEKKSPLPISVEDITSYFRLLKEKVRITNQKEVAISFNLLAEKVGPLALGNLNRFYSHTRLLIEKLLRTHKIIPKKRHIKHIVDNLTEKIFFHGHVIARKEAMNDIGLDIESPKEMLEKLMWNLYLEYEKELKLTEPFEPDIILFRERSEEFTERDLSAAYIESIERTDVCKLDLSLIQRRRMPTTLNLNINIQLPPDLDPDRIPGDFIQQLERSIRQIVNDQIRRQSEIVGIERRKIGGGWRIET